MSIVPDEIRRTARGNFRKRSSGAPVEKDAVEEAGLVKIDLLGNRSLAVIRDALALVEKNYGRKIDYASWDRRMTGTVKIFYDGNTFGVFLFESPATRQTSRR